MKFSKRGYLVKVYDLLNNTANFVALMSTRSLADELIKSLMQFSTSDLLYSVTYLQVESNKEINPEDKIYAVTVSVALKQTMMLDVFSTRLLAEESIKKEKLNDKKDTDPSARYRRYYVREFIWDDV